MCIPGSLKESLAARMNDDERNISEKTICRVIMNEAHQK